MRGQSRCRSASCGLGWCWPAYCEGPSDKVCSTVRADRLHVTRAFLVSELDEGQTQELLEAGEGFDFVVAAVVLYATLEVCIGR